MLLDDLLTAGGVAGGGVLTISVKDHNNLRSDVGGYVSIQGP